jgi:hypothetical protein
MPYLDGIDVKDLLHFFCIFIFNSVAQEAFFDSILLFLDDPIFSLPGGLKGSTKIRDKEAYFKKSLA